MKISQRKFKKITLIPPKLAAKKTVLVIAFRIASTLDVKIVWFGRQVAVSVKKRHTMQFLGVVVSKVQLRLLIA